MRYSVHPSRAFRNRIAKSMGVLVAAALIATLGLPSAAQAQTIPAKDGIMYTDDDGFMINWGTRFELVDNWIVTITKPNGEKVVVNQHTTNPVGSELGATPATTSFGPYNQNDMGTWWFQVDACFIDWGALSSELPESEANLALKDCPGAARENGTPVGFTHGPFPAPANLAASLISTGGVALIWTSEKSDHGFVDYQYSMNADAAKPTWKTAGATGVQRVTADPGEHTFSVRARGESDNDKNTDEGSAGVAESMGMVASVEITVPTPTPTLPEIAALFLAMLLLGSGAYLLRGRQSGGLSQA